MKHTFLYLTLALFAGMLGVVPARTRLLGQAIPKLKRGVARDHISCTQWT